MTETDSSTPTTPSEQSLWHNRTFVRFLSGQLVTNAGDSLYTVAILWVIQTEANSTVLTGIANAMLLSPWLLQLFAGPLVDRWRTKRLLVGAQLLQGLVVLIIPIATMLDSRSIELLFCVIPVLALLTTACEPVVDSMLPRIVRKEQLSAGNSALATVTLGLDMALEAVGGLFIALVGTTTLFVVDSLSFAIASALFAGMVVPSTSSSTADGGITGYVEQLRDGVSVLRGTLFVEMIGCTAVFNFTTGVALAVLPAFAASKYGPAVYGLLLGALGIGRMLGSLSGSWFTGVGFGRLLASTNLVAASLWIGSVYAGTPELAVTLFGLAWIPAGLTGVLVATMNQSVFPTSALGRISATKGAATGATLPLGSLLGGLIGAALGPELTMALAGCGYGFSGCYYTLRTPLRRLPSVDTMTATTFGLEDDFKDE
ncbi:MFS transporter [Halocatena halophila]|uniref:MFS transporter n=1 Tax=Halocatena halophila TaxID=2814576 RepID=UPI002ED4C4F0